MLSSPQLRRSGGRGRRGRACAIPGRLATEGAAEQASGHIPTALAPRDTEGMGHENEVQCPPPTDATGYGDVVVQNEPDVLQPPPPHPDDHHHHHHMTDALGSEGVVGVVCAKDDGAKEAQDDAAKKVPLPSPVRWCVCSLP